MVLRYRQWMIAATESELPMTADAGQYAYVEASKLILFFDGNSWTPGTRVLVKKEMTTVNARNVGTTLVYTLEPSSLNFYPALIIPRAVSVSGVILNPTISIGSNAPSYNNIAAASLLGNVVSALTGGNSLSSSTYSPALPGGTSIYANVTVAATGLGGSYQMKYDIMGYYDL